MTQLSMNWLYSNWQRKLTALIAASVLWFYMSHSMTETKTLPGVAIKVVSLATDRTINGLLPNGVLSQRVTLTLTGTKRIIENIEPNDLEVILDASNASDDWVVQITKKNLVSLDPTVDLQRHITQVQHQEFLIELSELITAKIPITISTPTGEPPEGYQFLGIWPQRLMQTVSGPVKEIKQLRATGLEITFDLRDVRKQLLDTQSSQQEGYYEDEITFKVPENWKKVAIPFQQGALQPLNDPEAKHLRMDFLRMQFIPLKRVVPIRVFYPESTLATINPQTAPLKIDGVIKREHGLPVYTNPVLAYHVSQLFFDIVKEYMEITIVASPGISEKGLPWSIEFNNSEALENRYIDYLMKRHELSHLKNGSTVKKKEAIWRNRFRHYMQRLRLYQMNEEKLSLHNQILDGAILVN